MPIPTWFNLFLLIGWNENRFVTFSQLLFVKPEWFSYCCVSPPKCYTIKKHSLFSLPDTVLPHRRTICFDCFIFQKKLFRLLCSELFFFSDSVWSSLHKTNIAFLFSINFSGQNVKILQCCFSYLFSSCVPHVLIFETFDTRGYKWDKLSCLLTAPDSIIYIRYAYDSIAAYLYNLEFTMGHECNFAFVLLSNYLKKYVSAWFTNYLLFRVFSANLANKIYQKKNNNKKKSMIDHLHTPAPFIILKTRFNRVNL